MKLSRQFCDFCGVVIKDGDKFATMSVPNLPDGERVDATELPEPKGAQKDSEVHGMFQYLVFSVAGSDNRSYDICLSCVRSFLTARFWALKEANGTMNRIAERKTRLQEVG